MKKSHIFILCLIFVTSSGVGVGAALGLSKIGVNNSNVEYGEVYPTPSGQLEQDEREVPENGYKTGGDIKLPDIIHDETYSKSDAPSNSTTPTPHRKPNITEAGVGDKINISPTIEIGNDITLVSENGPVPNPDTQTYTYSVTAKGGLGGLTYHLYASRNAKDTISNHTGNFINIPSVGTGKYILLVVDATGNAFKKEIKGFIKINKPLTTSQLSLRLSRSTPDKSMGAYFASGYEMTFKGLKSSDPKPTNYTSIYSNIASGYWKEVRVISVEYNDYNKITKITMSVTYNY